MTTMARSTRFLALLAFLGALIFPVSAQSKVVEGDPFPVWTLTDLSGRSHEVGSIGNITLLYFLGSGCSICADLARKIEQDIVRSFRDDITVYAIDSLDGSEEDLARLRDEADVSFPFLRNGSALTAACGIAWHAIVVVDDEGIISYVSEGANDGIYRAHELQETLERLVGHVAETRTATWGEIKTLYGER
jgi:hypothetical protein